MPFFSINACKAATETVNVINILEKILSKRLLEKLMILNSVANIHHSFSVKKIPSMVLIGI